MLIKRLHIKGVRNISAANLEALSTINIFFGENGAGKTSVLEAIHLLSSARSFRSHKISPLIANTADGCVAFGEINVPGIGYQPVGVERFKSTKNPGQIRVAGQTVKSASALAENLPLQVICSDTFKILEGSPSVRRQFMDWGVFHVEQQFHEVWKNTQRCLKQRNSLLRHGRIDAQQLATWTAELARSGEQLHQLRKRYFEQFVPVFQRLLARLIDLDDLSLSYYRGWDKERSLLDVLNENGVREQEQGHTLVGPHRADLRLRYRSAAAADMLSRGQQKLVVCALRVAQGYVLAQLTGRTCCFLVDDLPAELDMNHRQSLCKLLEELQCQVFVTCVDHRDMLNCWSPDVGVKLFHVEHGSISAIVDEHSNE